MLNNALFKSPLPSRGRVREEVEILNDNLYLKLPPSPALPTIGERELKTQIIEKQGGWSNKKVFFKTTPPVFRCFVRALPC